MIIQFDQNLKVIIVFDFCENRLKIVEIMTTNRFSIVYTTIENTIKQRKNLEFWCLFLLYIFLHPHIYTNEFLLILMK